MHKTMGLFKKFITGSYLLYRTNWYKSKFIDPHHEIYPDNVWLHKHEKRNYDLVNLGSSGGKWAFDYSGLDIKAMNWAQQPQTLFEDYNILRHFHSILKDGGYVIITIMPFTGLNKTTGINDAIKYLKFDLQGEPIEPHLYDEALRMATYPILFGKPAIKALTKYFLGKDKVVNPCPQAQLEHNPMNEEQLNADAKQWIEGWKRQFGIADFDAPLTTDNEKWRAYRIRLMQTLVDFCMERGYKPVYVIPPVTEHLARYYTRKFNETYIYGYLNSVNREVLTLDYSNDDEFRKNDDLFFNSFFLNRRGRKIFTRKVLYKLLLHPYLKLD